MGQPVFVLTSLTGEGKNKEWRPVAVVTDGAVAQEWVTAGEHNDWIPFDLDDVDYIDFTGQVTPFKPRPEKITPNEQKAVQLAESFEAQNKELVEVIKQLQEQVKALHKQMGIKPQKKQPAAPATPKASLLKRKER